MKSGLALSRPFRPFDMQRSAGKECNSRAIWASFFFGKQENTATLFIGQVHISSMERDRRYWQELHHLCQQDGGGNNPDHEACLASIYKCFKRSRWKKGGPSLHHLSIAYEKSKSGFLRNWEVRKIFFSMRSTKSGIHSPLTS